MKRQASLVAASLWFLSLAACLAPPPEEWDRDGDGVAGPDDCDDGDPARNWQLSESCDGVDNDCDEDIDEGLLGEFRPDDDGDGFPSDAPAETFCADEPPEGYVAADEETDCDDAVDNVFPGAAEFCDEIDNDCDGIVDNDLTERTYYPDADGDGFGDPTQPLTVCEPNPPDDYVLDSGDCNDEAANANPESPEVCDGIDNNCVDGVDEGLPTILYGFDADGDGFGAANTPPTERIEDCGPAPAGYAEGLDDCDDGDASVNPAATEVCDGADNDCDGVADGDTDGDGFTICDGDCDDGDATVNPGLPEVCDGRDVDCDGVVDSDSDGDGAGPCAGDCAEGDPRVGPDEDERCNGADDDCDGLFDEDGDGDGTPVCTDCDDTDPTISPLATEICGDGVDQNCAGGDFDRDSDGDGYTAAAFGCGGPDCNDLDAGVHPDAPEACDGIDNDCDALVDEASDFDEDGVGSCDDCDDTDPRSYPGAPEICDGRDNDCDASIDELPDGDFDGFGPCEGDCDDSDGLVNPGASESCNGRDDDCDGGIDEGLAAPEEWIAAAPGDTGIAVWRFLDPGFAPAELVAAHPPGSTWRWLAIDDLDGDGILELLAQTSNDPEVWRYDRTCVGGWSSGVVATVASSEKLIATFDGDGNGLTDLITTTPGGAVRVHLQLEDGGWLVRFAADFSHLSDLGEWTMGRHPRDHTGDDVPDLVACGNNGVSSGICQLFHGVGNGTFDWLAPETIPAAFQVSTITEADFNGDGLPDLLLGMDDDGDPGQVWMIAGLTTGFTPALQVFDVNTAVESGSDAGGRGQLLPMYLNGDDLVDAVALWDPNFMGSTRVLSLHTAGATGFSQATLDSGFLPTTTTPNNRDAFAVPALP